MSAFRVGIGCLLAGLMAGCSAARWNEPAVPNDSTAPQHQDMTRSKRGNPPVYEVFGVRYQVLDESAGYRERGIASWYGKKFHGRLTSSGERYDMYRMTAAHKTLPLPTNVRVTNLENGKSVVVRVNDRGPFVDGRIIDLSYVAAKAIGMTEAGTARVEIEALDTSYTGAITAAAALPPAAGPQSAATNPSEAAIHSTATAPSEAAMQTAVAGEPSRRMYVQVGAFGESGNATRLAEQLAEQGVSPVFVHQPADPGDALYRVRIGPFASLEDYDRILAQITALEITRTQLVVEDADTRPDGKL